MKDNYRQGDRVKILPNSSMPEGLGTICGISVNGVPVLGRGWIIQLDKPIKGHEYSHVSLFSNMIEPFYDREHPRYVVQSLDRPTQHWIYDNKESYYVFSTDTYDTTCKEDADMLCKALNEKMM